MNISTLEDAEMFMTARVEPRPGLAAGSCHWPEDGTTPHGPASQRACCISRACYCCDRVAVVHCQMQQARMNVCIATVLSAPRYPVCPRQAAAISELNYDKIRHIRYSVPSAHRAPDISGMRSFLEPCHLKVQR